MLKNTFSIRRPITVAVIFIALTVLGLYSFTNIGIDLLPNVAIPHLIVQTNYSNALPEEIEKQITEPLESAVSTVPGVKKVTSLSKEGVSVISVDFVWGTDMKIALLSLREKLDNMSFALPQEAGRPTIIRSDPSASPIMSLVLTYSKEGKRQEARSEKREVRSQKQNEVTSDRVTSDQGSATSDQWPMTNVQWPVSNDRFLDHSSPSYEISRLINLKEAARVIFKRRFEQMEDIAQAVVTGGLEREILVLFDPAKLNSLNLTFTDISSALNSANINLPAGAIMKGLFRYSLRTQGEFQTIDDIKNTVIRTNKDGSTVLLKNIADVSENFKEREGLTRLNGSEAVGILIYKQAEANTVSIAQSVREMIKSFSKLYPDYKLQIVSDQSGFIEQAISNVKQEILYGGILAVVALFFFLGSIRNIFIIGITIPSSLVITILLLNLFGINFNIISLGGIAVGIGMLLDNAIIVIENVVRYKEQGLSNRLSAIKGTQEVAMPVIASTLTTIAVFLPLIFVRGVAGELFKDQSYAIAFSLTASIITALTLIPMLASRDDFRLIKNPGRFSSSYLNLQKPERSTLFGRIKFYGKLPFAVIFKSLVYVTANIYMFIGSILNKRLGVFFKAVDTFLEKTIVHYENLLEWALKNKKKVLLLTAGLIVVTVLAFMDMKKEFIPKGEQEEFMLELDYPTGTSLRGNAVLTSKVEEKLVTVPHVSAVVSNIGRVNEFDFLNKEQAAVNKTNILVKLDSYENYYPVQSEVRKIINATRGIKFSMKDVATTYSTVINPSENDIVIKIKNKDLNSAYAKASAIINKINTAGIEGLNEVRMGTEKGIPEYSVVIDREKCLSYGLTVSQVANQITNIVRGNIPAYFSDFDQKVGINIRANDSDHSDIEAVLGNYVINRDKKILLGSLVTYNFGLNFNEIWREDQSRTSMIYASIGDADLNGTIKKIENAIAEIPKSGDEIITVGGVNEEIHDAFSALYIALIISVLLMYMVLASEFESFLFPFIILFSVPLGLIGSILLLFAFGESINIISIMGLIILVGIADNDAVVKVEFILRKREEGLIIHDAIVQAGQDRFRPIVMNSFTVIFGLLPMMIGIGAATQLRVSLSLAVIGGLISSTFLTLIIIPVLYSYFEKYSRKKFPDNQTQNYE